MRAYVAITDNEWFELLRASQPLDEINFWQPGGSRAFTALEPGQLFLFKLHSPRNFVVGGGIFAYSTLLPVSLAWTTFGISNGVTSLEEIRERIKKYRKSTAATAADYTIGCILLTQPFFFEQRDWIPIPRDWSPSIQQGKGYDLTQEPGRELYRRIRMVLETLPQTERGSIASVAPVLPEAPRYGQPVLVAPRLGQGGFRVVVTDAYSRRCAISGERVLPVLEAAHIRPFAGGGPHRVDNGLLLRSDLHTLFDRGYLTVTPQHQVEVSASIREEFENGRAYYALHGSPIREPMRPEHIPSGAYLSWHNEHVFRS